jgi:hypothetical protein
MRWLMANSRAGVRQRFRSNFTPDIRIGDGERPPPAQAFGGVPLQCRSGNFRTQLRASVTGPKPKRA